jgi:predicted N-acetyltransferase YhbS
MRSITVAVAEDPAEVANFRCEMFGGREEAVVKDVARQMRDGKVLVARQRGKVVGTLCLTTKKPWAIDASYFTKVRLPLYLLAMAVAVPLQRKGIGRLCLREAEKVAAGWPAGSIRLDAFDSPTGAGRFYSRCGYREVGRAVYRQTPLIYFERLVSAEEAVGDGGMR